MDFKDVDVVEVLEFYSLRNINETGDEVQFSCPFPEHSRGDQRPSSSINQENGKWHCFGCGRSGSIANFVAEYEGISVAVAMRWLRENYYQGSRESSAIEALTKIMSPKKKKIKTQVISEDNLNQFAVDWRKVEHAIRQGNCPRNLTHPFRRYGLDYRTLEQFGIGFDQITQRITIPIRNADGRLVGFKGRDTVGNQVKYLALCDKTGHDLPRWQAADIVFGLFSADKDVIICEGEFDAMSLRQKQFKGSVAVGTSNISHEQIKQIKEHADRVTILFDPDKPGQKGAMKVANSLIRHLPVKIAKSNSENDPAEMTKEEVQQALNNAYIPHKEIT